MTSNSLKVIVPALLAFSCISYRWYLHQKADVDTQRAFEERAARTAVFLGADRLTEIHRDCFRTGVPLSWVWAGHDKSRYGTCVWAALETDMRGALSLGSPSWHVDQETADPRLDFVVTVQKGELPREIATAAIVRCRNDTMSRPSLGGSSVWQPLGQKRFRASERFPSKLGTVHPPCTARVEIIQGAWQAAVPLEVPYPVRVDGR